MNQQKSKSRTYHGDLEPQDMAQALVLRFKDGDTQICKACGAPLIGAQPLVCHKCGFLNNSDAKYCANCGAALL